MREVQSIETNAVHMLGCSLSDKHAVPVREKSVLLLDRMGVRLQHAFPPGKGRNEHQQGGFGQMEVGEQRADRAKLEAWIDKNVSLACASADSPRSL